MDADACLLRGSKRKLIQSTLFQLKFCRQSAVDENLHPEFEELAKRACYEGQRGALVPASTDDCVPQVCNGVPNIGRSCKSSASEDLTMETSRSDLCARHINGEGFKHEVFSSSFPLKNDTLEIDESITLDDISGVALETFIVGRKFSVEKSLHPGMGVSLSRDPNNEKDKNAIKVRMADSSNNKELGFLPRELAQYLSLLVDKYSLMFEGYVTSVPKKPNDAVPIKITCCNRTLQGQNGLQEIDAFRYLWKNIVESVKNYLPHLSKCQQNFCSLIREVLKSDPHLFNDDEKKFLELFFLLSDSSQRLFIRLYMRKGLCFRLSNISYPEVSDPVLVVKELSETGYIHIIEDASQLQESGVREFLDLLTVTELRGIVLMLNKKTRSYSHGTRKLDLVAHLSSSYETDACPFLASAILDRTGTCIKITSKAESLVLRSERLFFLNGEQDLSTFLLADMGIVNYPSYRCIVSEPLFATRSDVVAYEEALKVAQLMDESLDKYCTEAVLRCMHISSSSLKLIQPSCESRLVSHVYFSSSWVYSKVLSHGISFLEREHRYNDAIVLLKQLLAYFNSDGRRGYWTLRLSIDLEHIRYLNESLQVAEEGLLDPWVRAGSIIALQRRILRLGKPPRRWKIPSFSHNIKRKIKEVRIPGRPLSCEAGAKSRFYGEDGNQCGVEQLALQYYAGDGGGWHGVHTESGIWLTIFGLLMWDVIFSDIPNVFRNKFQTAPLDMATDGFYLARKHVVEPLLEKIQQGMAEEMVIISWESYFGTACRGVNWGRHSLSELRAAVSCIGGPCLALLCRHLAQDYQSWSRGLPDLLLWRFHGDRKGEARLVEVKGPRDRLSEQQRAWLLLLMNCGFDVEVCKVSPMVQG